MKRKITVLLLVLLAIIITVLIVNSSKSSGRPLPLQITEHVHFEDLWVNEDTFIGGNTFLNSSGFIAIENDNLLSLKLQQQFWGHNWVLRKQNLLTEENIWKIDLGFININGVINNTAKVFVVSPIQSFCGNVWKPNCESIRVTAYDINNGNEKWSQVYDGMLNINWMEVNEEIIELHGSANRGNHRATFKTDASTGEMIWSGNPTLSLQEIREKDRQQPEYFVPQEVTSPVISDIAECNKISYFVTADGILWATEQVSRSTVGMVDFSPKEYDINIFDVQVRCEDFFVVVYFEDSRQIFAFRFSKNDGD